MANYTAYIPAVGSTTYPTQISNFITISEAFDTEIETARNGEATLFDGINLKLSLTGGTLTGSLTISTGNLTVTTGNVLIGTDTVAVKDAALTNGNIVSADSSGRVTTDSGISTNNIATLSGTQTITGNKTFSGINIISGINTFSAIPAFNGGTSGSSSPFTVDSTQVVTNLNANLLGGISATAFARSDIADTINGIHTHTVRPVFNGGVSGSSSPFTVDSTQVVANLNANLLEGQQGSYYAPINSPALTGNPTAPTPTTSDDDTSIATTEFVKNIIAFRGCLAYHNTAQSILNNTATKILFNSESYDTDGIHSTSSNTSRLTVPAGVTKIKITVGSAYENNATGSRSWYFLKNGFDFTGAASFRINGSASLAPTASMASGVLSVVGGDYFETETFQSSGGAITLQGTATGTHNWFAMEIIE